MKEWPALPPDDELERADSLLDQADALLRRHRLDDRRPNATADDWTPSADFDDEDLPILTEIVEDFELPAELPGTLMRPTSAFDRPPSQPSFLHEAPGATVAAAAASTRTDTAAPTQDTLSSEFTERLVELDTAIARELGNWIAAEMPQILARELDQLAGRVQAEMQAHLRATLLPALSARVSSLLDHAADAPGHPAQPLDDSPPR